MRRGFDPFIPPRDNIRRLREGFGLGRQTGNGHLSAADTWEHVERSMIDSGVMVQLNEQKRMIDQFRHSIGVA